MKNYKIDHIWSYIPFLNWKRPKAVERQIERYWEETSRDKRKIRYQYITLERYIAKYNKIPYLHIN